MKRWIVPLMLGFGVAMAVIIGKRMSTDAMAVVIGVVVGVAASIPTSLLLVALLRHDRRVEAPPHSPHGYSALPQPPVIVINSGDRPGQTRNNQPSWALPPPEWPEDGGLRRLRVVGDDDDWMEDR